ncbi:MAG: hypothetical protein H7X93_05835 [Sphingomonadaceae bacterium]|nr:hypothetical protein [Sphingomonadaceae bacterium]
MSTFFLHVGMHKTASSAVQQLFAAEPERLEATGLRYFPSPNPNHSFFLMSYAQGRSRVEGQFAQPTYTGTWQFADREAMAELWTSFLAETSAAGHDALLSGEEGGFLSDDEIDRLIAEIRAYFDRIVVLGMVRPPLAFARSAAQQRLRGRSSFRTSAQTPPVPKYRERFGGYVRAVGRENVRLRVFHRDRLVAGDPAQTLLAMMEHADPALADMRAPRLNESMSMPAAKLFSALNVMRDDPAVKSQIPGPIVAMLRELPKKKFGFADIRAGRSTDHLFPKPLSRLVRTIPGDPFSLPIEIQRKVLNQPPEDADWVSEMLGEDIRAFDVAIDETAPTLAEAEHITEDETRLITRHIADHMRERVAIMRAASKAREEQERAAAQGA